VGPFVGCVVGEVVMGPLVGTLSVGDRDGVYEGVSDGADVVGGFKAGGITWLLRTAFVMA
jgi:hypothetical protein